MEKFGLSVVLGKQQISTALIITIQAKYPTADMPDAEKFQPLPCESRIARPVASTARPTSLTQAQQTTHETYANKLDLHQSEFHVGNIVLVGDGWTDRRELFLGFSFHGETRKTFKDRVDANELKPNSHRQAKKQAANEIDNTVGQLLDERKQVIQSNPIATATVVARLMIQKQGEMLVSSAVQRQEVQNLKLLGVMTPRKEAVSI